MSELHLGAVQPVEAPDGSDVYVLSAVDEAGSAVFELPPLAVSRPVRHPRIQEIWFVLSGRGRLWRRPDGSSGHVTTLVAGTSLTIPRRTAFQFRCDGDEPLRILGATAPPWGGDADAERLDHGMWPSTL